MARQGDVSAKARVLIISSDDGSIQELLSGARRVPDLEVAGVAARLDEALRSDPEMPPDIVLLDSGASAGRPFLALAEVRRETGALVILVTDNDEPGVLAQAMESGASGVLPRSASADTVAGALQVVRAGGFYLEASRARGMVEEMEALKERASRPAAGLLTPRELEVVRLLAEGLSARQIGRRLALSERTVNTHVANVYRKLGVSNRVEAVREAIRMRIVRSD